ncbi:hypothetical protein LPUS_03286 [Lasallia pustulata]|uniref:Thymidylate kinase n=1 Tax=Lasallia pustulata TaxID=136370 RepID=A0A1W5CV02_9LECA|nr:hypothetical protein LPUS_03286 [Lasallia pustulata]
MVWHLSFNLSSTSSPTALIENFAIHIHCSQLMSCTALPTTLSSPVKRRYSPSTFDDINSENIDPSVFSSPTKKFKSFDGTSIKPIKGSQFVLTNVSPAPSTFTKPAITPTGLNTPQPPLGLKGKTAKPSSAPVAAGRSPKSNRIGILSRRRVSASPFTRIDPPMVAGGHSQDAVPFSIDAALSGIVSSYKAKPQPPVEASTVEASTLKDSIPKGWMFEIHEDTTEEEMGNLMEHSTCTLDISDNEWRQAAKDDRGKENIPPLDFPGSLSRSVAATARPVSRHDMMTDEPRSSLGDLDARDYWAEGCDASSYYIIPAEKSNVNLVEEPVKAKPLVKDFNPVIRTDSKVSAGSQEMWKDLLAQIETKKSSAVAALPVAEGTKDNEAPIEIWESESAKGEDDVAAKDQHHHFVAPLQEGKEAVETVQDSLMA